MRLSRRHREPVWSNGPHARRARPDAAGCQLKHFVDVRHCVISEIPGRCDPAQHHAHARTRSASAQYMRPYATTHQRRCNWTGSSLVTSFLLVFRHFHDVVRLTTCGSWGGLRRPRQVRAPHPRHRSAFRAGPASRSPRDLRRHRPRQPRRLPRNGVTSGGPRLPVLVLSVAPHIAGTATAAERPPWTVNTYAAPMAGEHRRTSEPRTAVLRNPPTACPRTAQDGNGLQTCPNTCESTRSKTP